ncbi:unnamed protein product, partial [Polarella glacialis]
RALPKQQQQQQQQKGGGKGRLQVQRGLDDSWGAGYAKGGGKGYSKGGGKGYGAGDDWGSAQDWQHDLADDWGKGGYGDGAGMRVAWDSGPTDNRSAMDKLTSEDKRLMKKITIVAQLDKVPKPHPAMQGMSLGRSGGGRGRDGGSLSSRFSANYGH